MQDVHLPASATQGVELTATGQLADVCVDAAVSFAVAFGAINERILLRVSGSITVPHLWGTKNTGWMERLLFVLVTQVTDPECRSTKIFSFQVYSFTAQPAPQKVEERNHLLCRPSKSSNIWSLSGK
jgi:hypothetical protein